MKKAVVAGLAVATVLALGACSGPSPTEDERDQVCATLSLGAQYRSVIDPVEVAADSLVEDFGRDRADAMDLVRTIIDEDCPSARVLL